MSAVRQIERMFLFTTLDPVTGNEGVLFMKRPEGQMPLIAADIVLFHKLLPLAQAAAKKKRHIVKIVCLSQRAEIGRIGIDGSVNLFMGDQQCVRT